MSWCQLWDCPFLYLLFVLFLCGFVCQLVCYVFLSVFFFFRLLVLYVFLFFLSYL